MNAPLHPWRRYATWTAALALSMNPAAAADVHPVQQTLTARYADIDRATAREDVSGALRHQSSDHVSTDMQGRTLSTAQQRQNLTQLFNQMERLAASTRIRRIEQRGALLLVDTEATLTGIDSRTGRPFGLRSRSLDTWRRIGTDWQISASKMTALQPLQPPTAGTGRRGHPGSPAEQEAITLMNQALPLIMACTPPRHTHMQECRRLDRIHARLDTLCHQSRDPRACEIADKVRAYESEYGWAAMRP